MSDVLVVERPSAPGRTSGFHYPNDRRLSELEAAVRDTRTAVVSLDCFDTILWRRVVRPIDVFTLLGEELRDGGHLCLGITPSTFARLRVAAEQEARRQKVEAKGTVEVDLVDVYRQLPIKFTGLTIEELRHREVGLEKRLTVADPVLADAILEWSKRDDLRIVVVSDIYLSSVELRVLLDRPELVGLVRADVITSADFGVGKEHGLWKALPRQLGVPAESILHVGNNAVADYSVPRAAGVRAVYWAEVPARLAQIVTKEKSGPGPAGSPSRMPLRDEGLTALRGRAAFAKSTTAHHDQVAWETGASVLGPILAGYADWVRERTKTLGITHALGVMREGRFLKQIVDEAVAAGPGSGLRCELLWASREALVRASIVEGSRSEVEAAMLARWRVPSVVKAAETLGVDLSALPVFRQVAEQAPHLSNDQGVLQLFLNTVLDTPQLREQMVRTAKRRRANFVRHLRQALGGAEGQVAVLDVGWAGTNQEKLQSIIDAEGLGVQLHGLYLSDAWCTEDRRLRGHQIEGFLPGYADSPVAGVPSLLRNCHILELFLLSDDGMTLEIGNDGQPVCASYRTPQSQTERRQVAQAGVLAYQKQVGATRSRTGLAAIGVVAGDVAQRILERFVTEPTLDEAVEFGDWEWEDDHGNVERTTLVPTARDGILRRLTPDQLAEQPAERIMWPAGATAVWDGNDGRIVSGALAPGGVARLEFAFSGGKAPASDLTILRSGRDGVAFASWSGDGSNLERVTVYPTTTAGILRLDCLELSLKTPTTGWRTPLWTWNANDDPQRLLTANCDWASPNFLNVKPESALTIQLGGPLPSPAFIQIELRGGFLSFADGGPRVGTNPDGTLNLSFKLA